MSVDAKQASRVLAFVFNRLFVLTAAITKAFNKITSEEVAKCTVVVKMSTALIEGGRKDFHINGDRAKWHSTDLFWVDETVEFIFEPSNLISAQE